MNLRVPLRERDFLIAKSPIYLISFFVIQYEAGLIHRDGLQAKIPCISDSRISIVQPVSRLYVIS
jgi:hypothetical protein